MKEIILPCGNITLVSDEDYWFCISKSLYLQGEEWARMVAFCERSIHYYLHREIANRMGLDMSFTIDHHDCNKLNNQRNNLRCATRAQQAANHKICITNKSGYKGVSYTERLRKWKATMSVNNGTVNLGHYDTAEEAAIVYDNAVRKLRKDFGRYNFPREGEQKV